MFPNIIICSYFIFYWLIKTVTNVDYDIVAFFFYRYKKIFLTELSSSDDTKRKILFTPWKLGSIKKFKYWFCACVDNLDWYLFQLIVLLKSDFNFPIALYCLELTELLLGHIVLYQFLHKLLFYLLCKWHNFLARLT